MKNTILFLILSLLLFNCKKKTHLMITMPKEEYVLVSQEVENLDALNLEKSKCKMTIDFKTGNFKGKYKELNFKGQFEIKNVASGIAKGFSYEVVLAFLQKDEITKKSEQVFFDKLTTTTTIIITPNTLIDTKFVNLSMNNATDSQNLKFVMLK